MLMKCYTKLMAIIAFSSLIIGTLLLIAFLILLIANPSVLLHLFYWLLIAGTSVILLYILGSIFISWKVS